MKKLLAILLAAVLCMSVVALVACEEEGGSETFAGTVSEASYESTEDAAMAFVSNEMTSASVSAEYVGGKKEADLTESEIEKLDLGDIKDDVVSVEKWTVAYTDAKASKTVRAAQGRESEDVRYVTVYIVVIEVSPAGINVAAVYEYRYYVPLPEEGERLSVSYFQSVFDPEKYQNYTMECDITIIAEGQTQPVKQTIYFDKNAAKVEMSVMGISAVVYCVSTNSGVKCCMEYLGQIMPISITDLGISSLEDFYSSQISESECTFFIKTDYGFQVDESMYKDLITASLGGTLGSDYADMLNISSCKYDYYVSDGRMEKVIMDVAYSVNVGSSAMAFSTKGEIKYKNFGSTTVSISANAKQYLGID